MRKTYARGPPQSAAARPPKIPRSVPEYPCPATPERSSLSSCAADRSRSECAPAPRRARYRAGPRGRRPSVARRASTPPCACHTRCRPWGPTLPAFLSPASPGYILHPMTCHACGAQLSQGARFCHKCGAAVATAGATGWRAGFPWAIAGAALGALVTVLALRATGNRPGAGSTEQSASSSVLRAPDISQMSPDERANRLFNRVMILAEAGKNDSVRFFLPMALGAYSQLPTLDADARYGVGLGERGAGIAARQLQQAHVIAGIGVERGELAIGPQRHGKKEANAVGLAGLREDHDAIEETIRALVGRHLGNIGSTEHGAGRRLLRAPCSRSISRCSQCEYSHQCAQRSSGDRPRKTGPPPGGSGSGDGRAALVAEACSLGELGAAGMTGHWVENVTRAGGRQESR